ncbi:IS66 family insertion sequence element accessory protein TnpB [Flammeovirga sp. MY04]|uniref:IS66 family insertion sequence element accessory protein TnpA n=1 Tax=Flammeovirga sp. MY04 TaxID=1191459 RepID=UPI0008063392|nr:hypothetical protein [Flammeovirga sp. MY04]ANQ52576.1 IS66 family insertion sequence element accessory protein TnpB [Flammeovirga sp. MY04]
MSKKAEMYTHIASWKTSGLQQKAYCQLHSIKLSTFHYWVVKQRKENTNPAMGSFIPVKVPKKVEQTVKTVTLEYPNGVKLHLSDRELLKEAIHFF